MRMELKCVYQQYDWGKCGTDSIVACLLKGADPNFCIDENKPYAELWMGTHINGPSVLHHNGEKLSEWITSHPECLGMKVEKEFGTQLPFLFKVLSVNKALSIQAHPSKAHAEQLNRDHPELYKDANHKPEMAIAITDFEALCGFQPINDIKKWMANVPELKEVIGQDNVSQFLHCKEEEAEHYLKQCFRALMKTKDATVEQALLKLLNRINTLDDTSKDEFNNTLFKRLHRQYPGDVGCFSVYLLNYLCLKPGEALFLGSNEPHAYLFGDCMECMACSDNVVRAGLTPKYKDVETLCSMLNYKGAPASMKYFKPINEDKHTLLYKPSIPDFAVAKIVIPPELVNYQILQRESASIIIVLKGEAVTNLGTLKMGSIFFLPENHKLIIQNCCMNEEVVIFQAFCNTDCYFTKDILPSK